MSDSNTTIRGVVLAGGRGTRLYPLTRKISKNLLPVGREPMICHSIRQLTTTGVKQILVVTNPDHLDDFANILGHGEDFGCQLSYKAQEKPLGVAHALASAEDFASGEKIAVLLADNIFERTIRPHIERFAKQAKGARVLLKSVNDPRCFGIAELNANRILSIEEKPKHPKSNYAVVGAYFYDSQVSDIIRAISPSERGEYEITSVNKDYLRRGQLEYDIVQGEWIDAGTFESWMKANEMVSGSAGHLPDFL